MTNTLPIIASVHITTDEEGRFNLNALHRASGEPDSKKPSEWLRGKQAQELIAELEAENPAIKSISTIKGRGVTGTFASEEIAVSYAGWVSPAFQIKVNRAFISYRKGNLVEKQNTPAIPQNFADALQLAANQARMIEGMKPKVEAHDRLLSADGLMCLRDAMRAAGLMPQKGIEWLKNKGVLFYEGKALTPKSYHVGMGYFKVRTRVVDSDIRKQTMVTPKGIDWLAAYVPDDMKLGG